jgi:hypothetical protein
VKLGELFVDVRRNRRVADVGVDLAARRDADRHRFEFGVVDVGRDDEAAGCNLGANQFGVKLLPPGDKLHFLGDAAQPSVVHLGEVAIAGALHLGAASLDPLRARLQNLRGGVAFVLCVVAHSCLPPDVAGTPRTAPSTRVVFA